LAAAGPGLQRSTLRCRTKAASLAVFYRTGRQLDRRSARRNRNSLQRNWLPLAIISPTASKGPTKAPKVSRSGAVQCHPPHARSPASGQRSRRLAARRGYLDIGELFYRLYAHPLWKRTSVIHHTPRFNKSSYRLRMVCTNRILSKIRPRLVTTDIDRGHLFSVCSPALFSCTASAAFRTLVPLCHRISCCAGRSWIGLARLELDPCRR
jgi:hypothetical protein